MKYLKKSCCFLSMLSFCGCNLNALQKLTIICKWLTGPVLWGKLIKWNAIKEKKQYCQQMTQDFYFARSKKPPTTIDHFAGIIFMDYIFVQVYTILQCVNLFTNWIHWMCSIKHEYYRSEYLSLSWTLDIMYLKSILFPSFECLLRSSHLNWFEWISFKLKTKQKPQIYGIQKLSQRNQANERTSEQQTSNHKKPFYWLGLNRFQCFTRFFF